MSESSNASVGEGLFVRDSSNPNVAGFLGAVVGDTVSVLLLDFSTEFVSMLAVWLSLSLNALTLTGATVGTITEEAVGLVIGVIDGQVDVVILDVAGVEVKDVLEDFIGFD